MEVNNAIDEWYGIWDDDFLYLIFSLVDLLVSSIEPWSNVHFRFLKFKRATPHKYIQIPICERSESFELTIFSIYMLNFQQKMDPQNPTMGKVAKKFQKPERNMGGCPFCALLKHGRKPGLFLMVYWKSSKTSNLSPTCRMPAAGKPWWVHLWWPITLAKWWSPRWEGREIWLLKIPWKKRKEEVRWNSSTSWWCCCCCCNFSCRYRKQRTHKKEADFVHLSFQQRAMLPFCWFFNTPLLTHQRTGSQPL